MKLYQNLEENKDNDSLYFMVILYLLGQEKIMETESLWKEYEEEIKYSSRFFPKSKLLERIKECSVYATKILEKGTILYRARKYNLDTDYGEEEIEQIYNELRILFPDKKIKFQDMYSEGKVDRINNWLMLNQEKKTQFENTVNKILNQGKQFWGFSKEESDAPQKEKVSGGRANAPYIRYLYTAEDIETAITEVQPKTEQMVSVAKVSLIENVKIFDFCNSIEIEDAFLEKINLDFIAKKFSIPNYGDEINYYPTQFLCEFIRELGFDGIRFFSSLKKDGRNVVLFNTESSKKKSYDIIQSEVYKVNAIKVDYDKISPTVDKN